MFTAYQLKEMMPVVHPAPSAEEYIQSPLTKEAIDTVFQEAALAAQGGYHGMSFYLSQMYELMGFLDSPHQYYEASQVLRFLKDPALGYEIYTGEDTVDLTTFVSMHWGDNLSLTKSVYAIKVSPNGSTTEILLEARNAAYRKMMTPCC
jgi:hypothetical protein